MQETGLRNGAYGADKFGFRDLAEVRWNLDAPALYEYALAAREAVVVQGGAICAVAVRQLELVGTTPVSWVDPLDFDARAAVDRLQTLLGVDTLAAFGCGWTLLKKPFWKYRLR